MQKIRNSRTVFDTRLSIAQKETKIMLLLQVVEVAISARRMDMTVTTKGEIVAKMNTMQLVEMLTAWGA